MNKQEYYREAIDEALDQAGVVLFPTVVDDLAKAVAMADEHRELAFHTPPNPMIDQMHRLEQSHKKQERDWEMVVRNKDKQIEDLASDVRFWHGRAIEAEAKLNR